MYSIRPAARLTLLAALFIAGTTQAAGIYKWVDDQGHIHYSQVAPTGRDQKQIHVQKAPSQPSQPPADAANASHADADSGATIGNKPAAAECETIVCRANRLEAQRLERERALREARAKKEKPLTAAQRYAKSQAGFQAAQDRKLVEVCKKRREVYCDKGPEEIRKQLQWKAQEQEWARQRELRNPYVPRYRGNDIYIN